MPIWLPRPTLLAMWTGRRRSTRPSTVLTSTPRTCRALMPPQGAGSNYTVPPCLRTEPEDHAIGRSRGGLSTKIHQLVEGRGRPLVIVLSAGQAGDSPRLKALLAHLRIPRLRPGEPGQPGRSGPGRPRTRPDALLGDKAYSSRANRAVLRTKRVKTVIPQRADEIGHRKRRGSAGGRPPAFDAEAYKGRNVVERSFNTDKQWRGIATRYDKLAVVYRGAVVLRAITMWL